MSRPRPLTDGSLWNQEPPQAAPTTTSTIDTSGQGRTTKPAPGSVYMGDVTSGGSPFLVTPKYISRSAAEREWLNLSEERRASIDRLAKSLDYRSTGRGLYIQAVGAAEQALTQGRQITPMNIISQLEAEMQGQDDAGPDGRGPRRGAYTGPVESIAVQAESDINAAADDIAIELLGRGATKEEKEKIVQRIRKAEMAQPQVTRREGPGRQVTQEGLTSQGREDILREVLSKRPEFEQYQLDTTVMDAMTRFVNQKKAVAGD